MLAPIKKKRKRKTAVRHSSPPSSLPVSSSARALAPVSPPAGVKKVRRGSASTLRTSQQQRKEKEKEKQKHKQNLLSIFPEMAPSDDVFKKAQENVLVRMTVWKNRMLESALKWVNHYLFKMNTSLAQERNCRAFKKAIRKDYQVHWLETVFAFAFPAVSLEKCSKMGRKWLRCE